jgi:hypothetical protein
MNIVGVPYWEKLSQMKKPRRKRRKHGNYIRTC